LKIADIIVVKFDIFLFTFQYKIYDIVTISGLNLSLPVDFIHPCTVQISSEDLPYCENAKSFSDGPYALDYLKREYCKSTQYIIILDINMPLMNGWEFLDEVKSLFSAKNFMVFMLSSSTDQADMQKAKDIELVKSFFCKPLSEEHLTEIEKLLH